MPYIRRVRTTQPLEAVPLDWSNPLTLGLRVGLSAASKVELAGGAPVSVALVPVLAPIPGAVAVQGLEAGNGIIYVPISASLFPADITLLVFGTLNQTYASGVNITAGFGNSGGTAFLSAQNSTTGGNRFSLRQTNGGSTSELRFSANNAIVSTTPVCTVAQVTANGFSNVYWNGVKDNGTLTAGSTGSNAYDRFCIGGIVRSTNLPAKGGNDGALGLAWDRLLSAAEIAQIGANPWQLFEPESIWVPVSAGGGATISATPGNAVADGTTTAVTRIIPALPGGSVADGTVAGVNRVIAGAPGNAIGDGLTAAVARSIPATPGNAAANGTTAAVARVIAAAPGSAAADGITATVINSGTTISCTPGNAVANGPAAAVTRIIGAALGNATANGATAAVVRVVGAAPGNAVADGIVAALMRVVPAALGNASANGVTAGVTRVIWASPGNAAAAGTTASVYDPGATTYVPALRRMNSPSRTHSLGSASRARTLTSVSRAHNFTSPYVPALRRMNSPSRTHSLGSASRARTLTSVSRAHNFTSPARNTA